ncbi:hypothetical protein B0H10DRAFT_2026616 [Mycena sp. CBHHK59/15]|nr:hypothetical protein B0H10DRAFT_2026616 [Mycena sp. CBHHK59/15]
MAAPQLPQIPALPPLPGQGILPPVQPQNPPTLTDITDAHEYNERISAARAAAVFGGHQPSPSNDVAARGLIYEKQVIEFNAGVAADPAWFQAWDQNSFQPLVSKVDVLTARMENGHRAMGHQDPFAIVPFRDGSDPTAAPHALPALHNTDNIRQLTGAQSTRYCTSYGIAQPGNLANRRRLIARHIGYYHEL